ncbi:MAG: FlgO family outer membrane protein [Pyrinomonadaceae bacterium]
MKRCPQCNRVETDDALVFCRVDGAALIGDSGVVSADSGAVKSGSGSVNEIETSILPHRRDADMSRPTAPTTVLPAQSAPGTTRELNRSKRGKALLVIAGLLLIAIVLAGSTYLYLTRKKAPSIESIAVMPFANASDNPDVEYLADGMTESLIKSLSQLPNLNVKARSSVFRYKGKETNAQTIGKELNVQAILNGRVVQRGDQLTLSLELIDAQTENVIWSEQYNRRQTDLVTLQSEIARDVSTKLKTKLSGADEQKLAKTYTANPQAYQLYLKGRYFWNKRTAENIRKAMEQFQQAAGADPNYALAYSGLADCYVVLGDYAGVPESETNPKAQAFAERALQFDDSLVEARTSLAYSYALQWQWDRAEKEFKTAIGLNPKYATAHHWYSLTLVENGRFEEALKEIKLAQELDPLSPIISYNVALHYLLIGEVSASIEQSRRIIDLDPNFPRAHQSLGLAYLKQESYPEAIAEFRKAVSLSPSDRQALRDLGYGYAVAQKRSEALGVLKELHAKYEKREAFPGDLAAVFAGLGDKDQAFSWLEKDFQARTGRLARVRYLMPFESLRSDPRYADLLRRMGLAN